MATRTGRPPNYGHDDLARAVAAAEAQNGAPSPAQVKATLCAQLGIAPTLNDGSFQAALAQYYEDRRQMREKALISGLPSSTRVKAIEQVRGTLEHAFLLMPGECYASMSEDAKKCVEEAEQETRDIRLTLRHLEAQIAERDSAIDNLSADHRIALSRVAELEDELFIAHQRLIEHASEEAADRRMRRALGELFGEITGTPEQKSKLTTLLYSIPNRSDDAA